MAPRRKKIVDYRDESGLCFKDQIFEHLTLEGCILWCSRDRRTTFENCTFRDIRIDGSAAPWAVFRQCHFEDIDGDGEATLLYNVALVECTAAGRIRNFNIGFMGGHPSPEHEAETRRLNAENLAMIDAGRFGLDIRNAELENCCLVGSEVLGRVLCRPDQAVIVTGEKPLETLVELGRAADLEKCPFADFFYGAPTSKTGIMLVAKQFRADIPEIVRRMTMAGLTVERFE